MVAILDAVNNFVWGVPALFLTIGVGIYLSARTGFAQIFLFPRAIKMLLDQFKGKNSNQNAFSPYRALCTALAATVGTGNLAGVAGAICIGGPGAVFWMWVCALLGMVTKYAEAVLSVRYKKCNSDGEWVAGPMYMIENGLSKKWKWLGCAYCFFCVVATLGVGNATQVNTVIGSVNSVITLLGGDQSVFGNVLMGIFLAVFIFAMLMGGSGRIGAMAERLVPFASAVYLLLGVLVLLLRADAMPMAFRSIIQGAFDPSAVTGGIVGSTVCSLRIGASRGVFTNEAGMGTAAIAHGAACVAQPVKQGLMGIVEVFIDTIVICTMTALVILCSGIYIPYGDDAGIRLTTEAFGTVLGDWTAVVLALCVCCFAVATILGWSLYGARCAQYLFGGGVWRKFVYLQAIVVVVGAILGTGTVWKLAEIVNGLMAIPNLITLLLLSPELIKLTLEYKRSPA